MAEEKKDRVELWLGFLQAIAWPVAVFLAVILLKGEIGTLLGRVSKVNVAGTSIELFQAVSQVDKQIEQTTATDADSPKDAPPSLEGKALVGVKQTLLSNVLNTPSLSRAGWAYCGSLAEEQWASPPNFSILNGQKPQTGQSYKATTDTYLRENPPRGAVPKGNVITVIPEGVQVTVLDVLQSVDPSVSNRTLVWVQVQYETKLSASE